MFKQVTVINAVIIYKKWSLKLKLCFLFSLRSLKREREFLAKRLTTRMTTEERELLYRKWDVPLEGKQRRIQFINKLWTNPHDSAHVQESAEIVAKLVGFREGGNLSKEMFELNFVLPSDDRPWIMGWKPISNLLNLWVVRDNNSFRLQVKWHSFFTTSFWMYMMKLGASLQVKCSWIHLYEFQPAHYALCLVHLSNFTCFCFNII